MRKEWIEAVRSGAAFRYALMATVIAIMVSTSLAVGLQFVCVFFALASPQVRARLVGVLREPLSLALLLFVAALFVGVLHGAIPWSKRIDAFLGWYRILFFYFAAAAFADEDDKRELLRVYLLACVIAAIASFLTAAASLHIAKLPPGIIVQNHATQGMFFSVGVGIAAAALLWPDRMADGRIFGHRYAVFAMAALLVFNIAFITPGRSGYVVLLIIVGVLAAMRPQHLHKAALGAAGAVLAISLVLASSGTVRDRLALGISEFGTVGAVTDGNSMGFRRVVWRTTAEILRAHPVLGVGTGSFETVYRALVTAQGDPQAPVTGDPHNQFLKIWTEQGLFGLAAILIFIGVALTTKGMPPYRQLAIGIVLAWCATSMASSHFSTFAEGRMFFFWIGALLGRPPPELGQHTGRGPPEVAPPAPPSTS